MNAKITLGEFVRGYDKIRYMVSANVGLQHLVFSQCEAVHTMFTDNLYIGDMTVSLGLEGEFVEVGKEYYKLTSATLITDNAKFQLADNVQMVVWRSRWVGK